MGNNAKRVLLLYNVYSDELGSSRPPLGTGYLAQALSDANIPYDVVDMKLGHPESEVLKKVQSQFYDVIGLSVYTVGHRKFFDLLRQVKKVSPRSVTIAGGPHVTLLREQILRENPDLDFAQVGEAEHSFVKFCQGAEPGEVPGLVWKKKSGEVVVTPTSWIKDQSTINWPRYAGFELNRYGGEMGIITSRGCPYSCIFCSVSLTMGKEVRLRSPKSVGDELGYWYRRGKRIFNFLDDNFTFSPEHVYGVCDEIDRRGLTGLTLRASNGVRADKLNRDILTRLKSVGFRSFGIGVEAGNDKVLATLKKGETISQIENTIALACELGFEVSLFFVYGTPGETIADIKDSIRIANKYPVFKADFYNLIPLPGTALWKWVEENQAWTGEPTELLNSMDKNLRFSKNSGKPFFMTQELGYRERELLAKRLRSVTLKIQRKGIERLFKRFGVLKYPLAWVCGTTVFQKAFFNNNLLRRASELIRFKK